ncbi:MAG: DUF389 domain-containing protein [Bacteroidales bacterium]|jgi:uncharacterized hydrophobic protein (TIGR00271 family)|nr:DUF389 domain-containing protein [Bacteroidales bacterium]
MTWNSSLLRQLRNIVNLTEHVDVEAAKNSIISNIEYKGVNVWVLIFAVLIASVGLNVNSIPVVIGAMLISPLLGPVMGVGLALGVNDAPLLRRSLKNFLIMAVIGMITSTVYFLITPLSLDQPTELLSRINPTIYDVFIALFGGLAIIIEFSRKEKSTVISGVAIATALMPPLCTAGYGIANGKLHFFFGASYLFFINSVFIALAVFLMVRYLKFPVVKFSDPAKSKKVHRLISLITLLLILPSIYSAFVVIEENRFNQNAKNFVSEYNNLERSYIFDYKIRHSTGKPSVLTISIAGAKLSPSDLRLLKSGLSKYDIDSSQLAINQSSTFPVEQESDKAMINSLMEHSDVELRRKDEVIRDMEKEILTLKGNEIPGEQIARELSAQYPDVVSLSIARGKEIANGVSSDEIIAVIKFSEMPGTEVIEKIENWLSVRLDEPKVKVIVEK